MRLIDADLLLEELNRFSMRITGSANAMALAVMYETKKSISKMVGEQPTAYDVDKTVKRLEVNSEYMSDELFIRTEDAIDIVKSGGIE